MHRYLILFLALSLCGQTGPFVPELASLDRAISSLLAKYSIPGAAAALAKDGRLLYARGFGTADLASQEPVQPDSLFRIASLSKPITAIAVLQLVENSKISLDTRVLPFLGRTAAADPRYADITVRHLLQH
ncbi:serine hydrolase domain-containing protein, partial [Nostoc sp. NIES-2111]